MVWHSETNGKKCTQIQNFQYQNQPEMRIINLNCLLFSFSVFNKVQKVFETQRNERSDAR